MVRQYQDFLHIGTVLFQSTIIHTCISYNAHTRVVFVECSLEGLSISECIYFTKACLCIGGC